MLQRVSLLLFVIGTRADPNSNTDSRLCFEPKHPRFCSRRSTICPANVPDSDGKKTQRADVYGHGPAWKLPEETLIGRGSNFYRPWGEWKAGNIRSPANMTCREAECRKVCCDGNCCKPQFISGPKYEEVYGAYYLWDLNWNDETSTELKYKVCTETRSAMIAWEQRWNNDASGNPHFPVPKFEMDTTFSRTDPFRNASWVVKSSKPKTDAAKDKSNKVMEQVKEVFSIFEAGTGLVGLVFPPIAAAQGAFDAVKGFAQSIHAALPKDEAAPEDNVVSMDLQDTINKLKKVIREENALNKLESDLNEIKRENDLLDGFYTNAANDKMLDQLLVTTKTRISTWNRLASTFEVLTDESETNKRKSAYYLFEPFANVLVNLHSLQQFYFETGVGSIGRNLALHRQDNPTKTEPDSKEAREATERRDQVCGDMVDYYWHDTVNKFQNLWERFFNYFEMAWDERIKSVKTECHHDHQFISHPKSTLGTQIFDQRVSAGKKWVDDWRFGTDAAPKTVNFKWDAKFLEVNYGSEERGGMTECSVEYTGLEIASMEAITEFAEQHSAKYIAQLESKRAEMRATFRASRDVLLGQLTENLKYCINEMKYVPMDSSLVHALGLTSSPTPEPTAAPTQITAKNLGAACWSPCGAKSGRCSTFCGTGRCCRKNYGGVIKGKGELEKVMNAGKKVFIVSHRGQALEAWHAIRPPFRTTTAWGDKSMWTFTRKKDDGSALPADQYMIRAYDRKVMEDSWARKLYLWNDDRSWQWWELTWVSHMERWTLRSHRDTYLQDYDGDIDTWGKLGNPNGYWILMTGEENGCLRTEGGVQHHRCVAPFPKFYKGPKGGSCPGGQQIDEEGECSHAFNELGLCQNTECWSGAKQGKYLAGNTSTNTGEYDLDVAKNKCRQTFDCSGVTCQTCVGVASCTRCTLRRNVNLHNAPQETSFQLMDHCRSGGENVEVHIGGSRVNRKTVTASTPGLVCPTNVDKSNWVGGYTYGDTFEITVSGNQVTARRTRHTGGWGMNLRIVCRREGACGVHERCCAYNSKYGMIPGVTWGTTPEAEKPWHSANNCDKVMGGSRLTQCPYDCPGEAKAQCYAGSSCGRHFRTGKRNDLTPICKRTGRQGFEVPMGLTNRREEKTWALPQAFQPHEDVVCPATVDQTNWLSDGKSGLKFDVEVKDGLVSAKRSDTMIDDPRHSDFDLRFQCTAGGVSDAYVRYEKSCIGGGNLPSYKDKSLEECKMLCDKEPRCQGVEYSPDVEHKDPTPQIDQWFCVVNLEAHGNPRNGHVTGPYKDMEDARQALNALGTGNQGNQKLICEVNNGVVNDDPHTVGGQAQNSGNGAWWGSWGDIHAMTGYCQNSKKCTDGIPAAKWHLALNIDPSDGHNFGFGTPAWSNNLPVGSKRTAFSADYKSVDAFAQTANYIAIVRHRGVVCEAARVWKFNTRGKTLREYLDITKTARAIETGDSIFTYVSPGMGEKAKDLFFSVDGKLAFNWWYSNNGVRISNTGTYIHGATLPGTGENNDDYHGLGNELGGRTSTGGGSSLYWFDVGVKQDDCHGGSCKILGTDGGTSLNKHTSFGSTIGYAVYVSDVAEQFSCDGVTLAERYTARDCNLQSSGTGYSGCDGALYNLDFHKKLDLESEASPLVWNGQDSAADCKSKCGGKAGLCPSWCGPMGSCCRQGAKNVPGCDASRGGMLKYSCVRAPGFQSDLNDSEDELLVPEPKTDWESEEEFKSLGEGKCKTRKDVKDEKFWKRIKEISATDCHDLCLKKAKCTGFEHNETNNVCRIHRNKIVRVRDTNKRGIFCYQKLQFQNEENE